MLAHPTVAPAILTPPDGLATAKESNLPRLEGRSENLFRYIFLGKKYIHIAAISTLA